MKKALLITISQDYGGTGDQLANTLKNEGVDVTRVYPFGVISVNADENEISKIKRHKEIHSIEEEKTIHLAPPDSPIQ